MDPQPQKNVDKVAIAKVHKALTGQRGADLASGVVTSIEEEVAIVETAEGPRRARRAAGCLLEPRAGDRVLVSTIEDGTTFVLSVLERPGDGASTISAPGDLRVVAASGKVEILAAEGVDIVSPSPVTVTSQAVALSAEEGHFSLGTLAMVGERLAAEIGSVKLLSVAVDTVIERVSQKLARSYKRVTELERLTAKMIRYEADKTCAISGENTLVTAKEVVKVDGEHIHIG